MTLLGTVLLIHRAYRARESRFLLYEMTKPGLAEWVANGNISYEWYPHR